MALTDSQFSVLRLVSDTIIPSIETKDADVHFRDFLERSATDLQVDRELADIIETKLEESLRLQFHRLLDILDSRRYNFLLTGRPVRFTNLRDLEQRTKYLESWRDSRLGQKRQAFQALKRLVCFLYYTVTSNWIKNPNWDIIGYPGPVEKRGLRHPENLVITPLQVDRESEFECDVCVVGSGAGGSVAAHELSKAGFDVIVVETGGYETSETFDQNELTMMNKLFDEYGTAATRDLSFVLLSGRGAGGGTTVNWMTCIRPPQEVLQDWEQNNGIPGLGGSEFKRYVDQIWNTLGVNQSESQMNGNNEILWNGCSALGYKEGVDYERIWRNATGCNSRCAFCSYGCVYSCKQSTILNYLPLAFHNGARFLFNTKIANVIIREGVARGVEGEHSSKIDGKRFRIGIRSKAVVLACGSIKTPTLLLRSGIKGKHIGTNLRLHPTTAISGHFRQEIRAWDGPPQTAVVTKFIHSDGPHHGFWIEAAPSHPGLFSMSSPWKDGRSHKDYMSKWFNHSSATIVLLKEWGSGSVRIDRRGEASVSYRLEQRDKKNMIAGMQEAARILVAAGAIGLSSLHSEGIEVMSEDGDVLNNVELDMFASRIAKKGIRPNSIMLFSAHLMGSCRMNSEDSLGATNPEGELYGVRNLFIADGSIFPTSLGVNPMITIMSMAKRTSTSVAIRLAQNNSTMN
ncbi:MAG: GMC family oxidoreductase N-terminal domain-containing protein [Thaumarchaeota archaeon]|nr:GMC family oxidoreductase N-terminal domain-containing protein [Nitrososphaerota archaeon]